MPGKKRKEKRKKKEGTFMKYSSQETRRNSHVFPRNYRALIKIFDYAKEVTYELLLKFISNYFCSRSICLITASDIFERMPQNTRA